MGCKDNLSVPSLLEKNLFIAPLEKFMLIIKIRKTQKRRTSKPLLIIVNFIFTYKKRSLKK